MPTRVFVSAARLTVLDAPLDGHHYYQVSGGQSDGSSPRANTAGELKTSTDGTNGSTEVKHGSEAISAIGIGE